MKKICFISQSLYTLGGVQSVVLDTINYMMRRGEYQITVLMPSSENKKTEYGLREDVEVLDIRGFLPTSKINKNVRRLYFKVNHNSALFQNKVVKPIVRHCCYPDKYLKALACFINGREYDTVVGVSGDNAILVGLIAPHINARTIGWMHTTLEALFTKRQSTAYGQFYLSKEAYQALDQILVLSHLDKATFDSTYFINTEVQYNPCVLKTSRKSSLNNRCLLWVGRLSEYSKGTDYLSQIACEILHRFPAWRLVIAGSGEAEASMRSSFENAGIDKSVQFLGRVSRERLIEEIYPNADILLSTSRIEGFGMTIVEAGCCAVPSIAFANSGPREIIANDQNGILVEPGNTELFINKLSVLMEDASYRVKLGEGAFHRAEDFSQDRVTEQLLRFFEGV